MTLLSTIQLAKNALFASQIGIQVASNNIANADTPGYVREKAILAPAPTQRKGQLVMGTGVQVRGIVRQVDKFVQQRLRSATSDLASGETREQTYVRLESVIGELSDTDLSTALTNFFNSMQDVLNQPETAAVRNLAVLQGQALTEQIQYTEDRVRDLRGAANDRIIAAASQINEKVQEIAKLNLQIMQVEKGGATVSDAVGLRDNRDKILQDLAKIVDIKVDEQESGAVNVFVGGDYLVFDGMVQLVKTVPYADRDLDVVELRLSNSDSQLNTSSGQLAGLLASRDEILAGFLDDLDEFTGTLIFEFNKIHASSQGLTGYEELTSDFKISDATVPLDEAGLPFTPVHGSLQVEIFNREANIRKTYDIGVPLEGLPGDTTLESFVSQLDAIDGLAASIRHDGRVVLRSESPGLEFGFREDTSGVLAALGINTFFTGSGSSDIGINSQLQSAPEKLALSQGGTGLDTLNGEELANLLSTPLASRNGASLSQVYESWMGETAQAASLSKAVAEGFRAFQTTLEGEHLGFSGVNLDEEAVNLITNQRTFQAAAKVIATVSEMLDVLINL